MSVVDDDQVVMLLQETLKRSLGGPRHVAPEVGLLTRPVEAIILTVLFGKY